MYIIEKWSQRIGNEKFIKDKKLTNKKKKIIIINKIKMLKLYKENINNSKSSWFYYKKSILLRGKEVKKPEECQSFLLFLSFLKYKIKKRIGFH